MKTITTIGLMVVAASIGHAQQHTETVKKELLFEKSADTNVLYIANINGTIDVEGYEGNVILIEAKKQISAKTDQRLEEGRKAINVTVMDRMDTLIVYTSYPCSNFGQVESRHHKAQEKGSYGYNWSGNKDCEYKFDFKVDYKIKVPLNTNLIVSTVNDGNISVLNVRGEVKAWNINGSLAFEKVSNVTYANTINGDVTLNFSNNPKNDGRYYSLNGDIRANYLRGFSADMSFKSFNGDFFTNLPSIEQLPSKLEIKDSKKGKGIAYKLDGKSMMRARNGGVYLDFETFNGNVYVKEN